MTFYHVAVTLVVGAIVFRVAYETAWQAQGGKPTLGGFAKSVGAVLTVSALAAIPLYS